MLNLPYQDNFFDSVYAIESLEHSIFISRAINEMIRVLKPGGKILIIDKNLKKNYFFTTNEWEVWFNPKKINDYFKKNKINSNFKYITYDDLNDPDQVFICWEGKKIA